MTYSLYIIVDVSGSMFEWGKNLIARNIVRAVEQYIRLGKANAEIKLVAWGKDASVIDWKSDDELPPSLVSCEGGANADALIALLEKTPDAKVVLITDGFWASADAKKLKRWKKNLPADTLRILKIGPDSNPMLKGDEVFPVENLFAALDGWFEGGDEW